MTHGGLAVLSWGSWQTTLTTCEWSGERGGGGGREGWRKWRGWREGGREREVDRRSEKGEPNDFHRVGLSQIVKQDIFFRGSKILRKAVFDIFVETIS